MGSSIYARADCSCFSFNQSALPETLGSIFFSLNYNPSNIVKIGSRGVENHCSNYFAGYVQRCE
jgi:hypothetical protein